MKNGIVYIAFSNRNKRIQQLGEDYYLKEVAYSMKTVKCVHPNLDITLFTDDIGFNSEYCDNVQIISPKSERVKQLYLQLSPYDNTLYLDSDTGVVDNIIDIFSLMERFDIAATFDHMRKKKEVSKIWKEYRDIPDSFSEFAGGVILFKKSTVIDNFFDIWRKKYKEWCSVSGKINDQPSFRVALYLTCNLHIYTLPPEYNIRSKKKHNIIPHIYHNHSLWVKNTNSYGGNIWM